MKKGEIVKTRLAGKTYLYEMLGRDGKYILPVKGSIICYDNAASYVVPETMQDHRFHISLCEESTAFDMFMHQQAKTV